MVAVSLACAALPAACSREAGSGRRAAGEGACEPSSVYGPPTCTTDDECARQGGPGWICDPTPVTYADGCGGTISWGRVCRPGEASAPAPDAATPPEPDAGIAPVPVVYGPPPLPPDAPSLDAVAAEPDSAATEPDSAASEADALEAGPDDAIRRSDARRWPPSTAYGPVSYYGPPPSFARDAGADSGLPTTPARDKVRARFESVRGAIRACTGNVAGTATVRVTISGETGRVSNVAVSGDYTGADATCIENVVRGLRFPSFNNPSLSINYSYRF